MARNLCCNYFLVAFRHDTVLDSRARVPDPRPPFRRNGYLDDEDVSQPAVFVPCLESALEPDGVLGAILLAEAAVEAMDRKSRMDDSDASSLTSRRYMSHGSS
jgi:hypothetical protein